MIKLSSLATVDEVEAINAYRDGARRQHPAWATINADDLKVDYPRMRKHHLANEAVGRVAREKLGDIWLAPIAKRIFQTNDYEDSAAAMAELRCYGSLLEAGIEVRPIRKERTPTADFEFEVGGDIGIVEVATKLEPVDQTERARLIEQGQTPEGVLRTSFDTSGARVDLVAYAAHPFGAPDPMKPGDTTQTNAISKICGVKAKEKQAVEGRVSILWIDFRDLGLWPGVVSVCDTTPLMSGHNGTLSSGAFWYASYGWKGAPVFEEGDLGRQLVTPLAHHGRFDVDRTSPSRYSAVVICLEDAIVLFENPGASTPISTAVRLELARLPQFDLHHSVADWSPGDVAKSIALSRSLIETMRTNR
ncbi:hypothetical protein BHAOGJBA_6023 [Methylobacterium hispanicum]|uniref:Uncharacterized protein n=1 Tax=Methylobacterium hispanicum TaxID=270350 RepID=A0AAV4ZWL2_9HYPH|nr:hypothetical protein [Methylobacterium hispanicum]GJD92469.1 hypothetical protein BHAOGJBA_6023 [Methylobacterium hispanicum]